MSVIGFFTASFFAVTVGIFLGLGTNVAVGIAGTIVFFIFCGTMETLKTTVIEQGDKIVKELKNLKKDI
ncbi:hypothetical protein BMS3Abin15_01201 [bacterium BMS3Abin15]|nr:hypothetical protein BMS3Abin15_01201 [bacterium BMS3Abin15]